MAKIILLSFADTKFRPTAERLRTEAESFGIFSNVFIPSEKDFDKWYRKKYWLRLQVKGMGYWMWKSYLVKKYYEILEEGDILFYIDAGCVLNTSGREQFNHYIDEVLKSDSGILVFQQDLLERDYTKADLLDYFDVANNKTITDTGQLYAGAFFIRKGPVGTKLIDTIYDICHNRIDLLSDMASKTPNSENFISHRYDQSVFSVCVKLLNPIIHSANETFVADGNWNNLNEFPIHARRLKSYDRCGFLLYRIKTPIRKTLDWLVLNNVIKFKNNV